MSGKFETNYLQILLFKHTFPSHKMWLNLPIKQIQNDCNGNQGLKG